jgi:DNA-binding MarR family transcriptional regulator
MPEHSVSIMSKLEKASVIQILLYLYLNRNHNEITLNEIIDNVDAASQTIQKTIDYLELNEFITVEKTKTFPFKHIIKLTELGVAVGQSLAAVASVLHSFEYGKKESIP